MAMVHQGLLGPITQLSTKMRGLAMPQCDSCYICPAEGLGGNTIFIVADRIIGDPKDPNVHETNARAIRS